jgi:alpha/beta superfamily hydrolase
MPKTLLLLLVLFSLTADAQEKITFPSLDGLAVTADYYKGLKTRPVILLYSRGEYVQTAKTLQKLGYTCLAIDQRSGNAVNGVGNETNAAAKQKKLPTNYLDAEKDIDAGIEYCFNRFQKKIVVIGSSYSASLLLKLATTNEHIARVIAFSPGEYFDKKISIADYVPNIKIQTWVTSSKDEAVELAALLKTSNPKFVKQFVPLQAGEHGSKVLWAGDEKTNEYWRAMLGFLKTP